MSENSSLGLKLFVGGATIATLHFLRQKLIAESVKRFTSPSLQFTVHRSTKQNKDQRTVLVTGGNGFLGKYIVSGLMEKGVNVVVFDIVLPKDSERDPSITYIRGNLLNPDHLGTALQGVDGVIHTASLIPFLGVPDQAIWEVNVRGTELLLETALRLGVKSLIYTSSATVVLEPNNRNARKLREDMAPPTVHLDTYTTTKYAAERSVIAYNGRQGLATAVLRPAGIFGAGDRNVTDLHVRGTDRVIIGDGHVYIDWVPVECVAHAHLLAEDALSGGDNKARARVAGQVYNIGNDEERTYGWFNGAGTVGASADLSHWQHPHPQNLPVALVQTLAVVNDLAFNLFRVQLLSPYFTPPIIDYTQRSYTFSIDKARRDLGYAPLFSIEEAIQRLVQRHRANQHK